VTRYIQQLRRILTKNFNIKLFNTDGRRLEDFKPIHAGSVGMYSCGPTVYDRVHIGNLRFVVVNDIFYRFFKAAAYNTHWVMNLTDIDDKMIAKAQAENCSITEIARRYTKVLFDDLRAINISIDEIEIVKATDHLKEMRDMVDLLVNKGIAYEASDGIYFAVDKFKDYGKFAGIVMDSGKTQARIANDTYDKTSPQDFALWKNDPDFEGGRPGWHIECSVMSAKYLGQPFDIHTGGVDLIFPHHQNEVAQSEAAYNKKLANYWLHNEFLMIEGEKMSKSLHNYLTLEDIVKKDFSPLALRYVLISAHYRTLLDFTWESIKGAETIIGDMRRFYVKSELFDSNSEFDAEAAYQKFMHALANDFNTPEALAIVFEVIGNEANIGPAGLIFMQQVDQILGLNIAQSTPEEIVNLLKIMDEARSKKDYTESDRIRAKLNQLDYEIENSAHGSYAIKRK